MPTPYEDDQPQQRVRWTDALKARAVDRAAEHGTVAGTARALGVRNDALQAAMTRDPAFRDAMTGALAKAKRPARSTGRKMKFTTPDGVKDVILQSGIDRLAYVESHGRVTWRTKPASERWLSSMVRKFAELGLWEIKLPGDGEFVAKNSWSVERVTDFGREILARWSQKE